MKGGGALVEGRNWGTVIDLKRKGVTEGRMGYEKIKRGREWIEGGLVC